MFQTLSEVVSLNSHDDPGMQVPLSQSLNKEGNRFIKDQRQTSGHTVSIYQDRTEEEVVCFQSSHSQM